MRFVLAAIGGALVTLAMLVTGLYLTDTRISKASLRPAVEVQPVPGMSRVDIAEWLRETRGDLHEDERHALESLLETPPPRWELAEREVSGFVQLSFTIQPDGRATGIEVYGAVPPGIYEEQAMEIVASRRYEPAYDDDGVPVVSRGIEVIDFTVPAEVARRAVTSP